jgi:hypothetical protein
MKALLAICLIVISTLVRAADMPAHPPAAGVVQGVVLEVKDVPTYTYMRLKTGDGEIWAATSTAPIKVGDTVTLVNAIVMTNFASKSLNKTFPSIIFGSLSNGADAGTAPAGMAPPAGMTPPPGMPMGGPAADAGPAAGAAPSGPPLDTSYSILPTRKLESINDEHIDKAKGKNAHTVGEIMSKGAAFRNKIVVVRGKVVKYNADIMGRNWVHLRDGSGFAADETNDILVTTKDAAKLGDIVTAKGVVHTDKDFGAGYYYKVLIEEAKLQ